MYPCIALDQKCYVLQYKPTGNVGSYAEYLRSLALMDALEWNEGFLVF